MVRCPHRFCSAFLSRRSLVRCTLGVQGVALGVSQPLRRQSPRPQMPKRSRPASTRWVDQLFREEVVRDTIMLHAVLVRPAELGIDDYPLVLPVPLSAGDVQRDRRGDPGAA